MRIASNPFSFPPSNSNHPYQRIRQHSPSFTHSRLAHGACNFHVAPSSSFIGVSLERPLSSCMPIFVRRQQQPDERADARALSFVRSLFLSRGSVGADEGERHPLKSSWEPITRVTQGRTHRVSTAPKILLRPRLIDRLKPKIMIVAARNESWKKGAAAARFYCPVWGGLSA